MKYFYIVIDHPRQKFISKSKKDEEYNEKSTANLVTEMVENVLECENGSFRFIDNKNDTIILSKKILEESVIKFVRYEDD